MIECDSPSYIGNSLLELSKPHKYKFHYDIPEFKLKNEKLKPHYMNTDSFMLTFEGGEIDNEIFY